MTYRRAAIAFAILHAGCRFWGTPPPAPPVDPPDVIIADFEQMDFVGFTATGAFLGGPDAAPRPGQDRVTGFAGQGYASSHTVDLLAAAGEMHSDEFTIVRRYLNFLVGGRYDPDRIAVRLIVDGQVVRQASGNAGAAYQVDHLAWNFWDVREFHGRRGQIRIVDDSREPGAHLMVDQFVMSAHPPARRDLHDTWLSEANIEVARAAGRIGRDPLRPIYHLMPAGRWMNNPSGPIFHAGYYHLFFQHNPFGDQSGHSHWGHVRSRDLVLWERLPIALWPSLDEGEFHCLSGCALTTDKNELMLLYTSAGVHGLQQWAAIATDAEATMFRKAEGNPVLSRDAHKDLQIDDWRNPFVFKDEGSYYLVLGGHPRDGRGSVFLYRSTDLKSWTFLGIPHSGQDGNWESPLLFRLGESWVLIYSPGGSGNALVRYEVGTLDLKAVKFTPQTQGIVDLGRGPAAKESHLHAPNVLSDAKGRRILFGWVRGFPANRGWNGAMTIPRVLSLDGDGVLVQTPAPELQGLRGQALDVGTQSLKQRSMRIDGFASDAFEITLRLELVDARRAGLKLRASRDGGRAVVVAFDGERLLVEEQLLKLDRPGKAIDLHVFIDRSVMEIFVDGGRQTVTRTLRARPGEQGVELFAAGGEARFENVRLFRMNGIWQDPSR